MSSNTVLAFPTNVCEQYAVPYAARGWKVFPVGAYFIDGGKNAATSDPEKVRTLFRQHPTLDGVGWAMPEGVIALDIDHKNGAKQGLEQWQKVIDDGLGFRDMPETLTATSGTGGKHIFLRIPAGLALDQGRFQKENSCAHVDLRGNGQSFVKVEGTPGYRFDNENPIADCPDWLLPMITKPRVIRETATVSTVTAGDFELRGAMHDWINKGVARAKANLSAPRNDSALWAVQQMRDSMAALGHDWRGGALEPFCEELRQKLSDLKPEPYTHKQMDAVIRGLGDVARPPAARQGEEPAPSWLTPAQVLRASSGNAEKFPTGFQTLDEFTNGGIRAGDLVIIKGHTEAGKTSLATQIAQLWAKRDDVLVVGIFDDEGRKAAAVRIGQGTFGIERDRLEAGEEQAVATVERLGEKIILPDPDAESYEQIAEKAAALAQGRKVVMILDSVQTIRTSEEADSERVGIKNLINAARRFNAKHGFRTLALSEVNRGAYAARAEKDRVSKLSSGAGSSRIEYGCELLIDIEGASQVEVLKNRIGGKKGRFAVEFDPETATFSEVPADVAAKRASEVRKAEESLQVSGTVLKILEALKGGKGVSKMTLRDLTRGSRETFARALKKAEDDGKVRTEPRPGRGGGDLYFLAD
jgi:KaiC/GvpD/RAD55 family RecA-like ATPase